MIHRELTLQRDDFTQRSVSKERTLSPDGSIIGEYNGNPILNALAGDVEFEDGNAREHMEKIKAENILTGTNTDRHVTIALEIVLSHRTDEIVYGLQDKCVYLNG